jgi:signal transduction histidine kinase
MAFDSPAAAAPPRPAASPGIASGARALYAVATSFDAGTAPGTVLFALLHRSAAAVGARRAWLVTAVAGAGRVAAAWPGPGEDPPAADGPAVMLLPLVQPDGPVGALVLASPATGSFSPADRRLGAALAHPAAGVAAAALRLAAAEEQARSSREAATLQAEVVAAVDHDLRTPLTTVLGALQTLARPEFAPADPDLAALLSSALGQAKRLRSLLGDLLLPSSAVTRSGALTPEALRSLIAEAARSGMGGGTTVPVAIPAGLPPLTANPPALRRVLDGVLRSACRRGLAARVEVAAWGGDAVIAVEADGPGPLVPGLSARLATAMGATLEESSDAAGHALVQLVLPGALAPLPESPT